MRTVPYTFSLVRSSAEGEGLRFCPGSFFQTDLPLALPSSPRRRRAQVLLHE